MAQKFHEHLARAEISIYVGTAIILVGAAFLLLGFSLFEFVTTFSKDLIKDIARLLNGLLLVLMLVEILHTVSIFLQKHRLVIEPFLAVGIIAAIRRILIITAEQTHPTVEQAVVFRMIMLELGLLTVMILAFVFCVFLLRRQRREESAEMEE
jgi:uncharacterized membrane protein (DUF373 family)